MLSRQMVHRVAVRPFIRNFVVMNSFILLVVTFIRHDSASLDPQPSPYSFYLEQIRPFGGPRMLPCLSPSSRTPTPIQNYPVCALANANMKVFSLAPRDAA